MNPLWDASISIIPFRNLFAHTDYNIVRLGICTNGFNHHRQLALGSGPVFAVPNQFDIFRGDRGIHQRVPFFLDVNLIFFHERGIVDGHRIGPAIALLRNLSALYGVAAFDLVYPVKNHLVVIGASYPNAIVKNGFQITLRRCGRLLVVIRDIFDMKFNNGIVSSWIIYRNCIEFRCCESIRELIAIDGSSNRNSTYFISGHTGVVILAFIPIQIFSRTVINIVIRVFPTIAPVIGICMVILLPKNGNSLYRNRIDIRNIGAVSRIITSKNFQKQRIFYCLTSATGIIFSNVVSGTACIGCFCRIDIQIGAN